MSRAVGVINLSLEVDTHYDSVNQSTNPPIPSGLAAVSHTGRDLVVGRASGSDSPGLPVGCTGEDLLESIPKFRAAEVVEERVDGRVNVGQPEGQVVHGGRHQSRGQGLDIKHDVEWYPTDHISNNDVGQGHKYLHLPFVPLLGFTSLA